jgi:hypothetical protein
LSFESCIEAEWHFQQLLAKMGWMSAEKDIFLSAATWPATSSKPAVIHEILRNGLNYMANPQRMQAPAWQMSGRRKNALIQLAAIPVLHSEPATVE